MIHDLYTQNSLGEFNRLEYLIAKLRGRITRALALVTAVSYAGPAGIDPAPLVTFAAPAFTPRPHGSGRVLILAGASGLTSGDGTESDGLVNILRGAVVLPPFADTGPVVGAAKQLAGSVFWVDTVPPGVPVIYSVQVTMDTGNILPPAGGLWIVLANLP